MTATELIARAPGWSVPHSLAVGAVVNPFAEDLDRGLRLLQRKVAAGATFPCSRRSSSISRGSDERSRRAARTCSRARASLRECDVLLRSERMAERACALPGVTIRARLRADPSRWRHRAARKLAAGLARVSRVDALHVFPLGAEAATREVSAEFG